MTYSIKRILIANRGEIACRVIRTCRRLGIETVAVASEVDQDLPHVKLADQAVIIGAAAAKESYLDIAKIVAVAKQYRVDAVHPGYGFLSENAGFAEALNQVGIRFIGPSAAAIRAMGSKSEAKAIAEKIAVPIIKGYRGNSQDVTYLSGKAEEIGFPILIKATHGGGGKGMRLVYSKGEFATALESCQREAQGAFGNAAVMLEKFVETPRHIELQVFGDSHGNVVALAERDCSLQRRHQKVIEEAPALGLSDTLRHNLTQAAIAVAKAVDYQGAGTVEFLVDAAENYYFLEMNTRLQVEHPVTEEILGLDLVEWQIRVAAGKSLPLTQEQIHPQGHAIEVRLYAEDPEAGFLPSTGKLKLFQMPTLPDCRVDAGYETGNQVSVFYDPMIAKIIVKGDNRHATIQQLEKALLHTQVQGVKTNQKFLLQLLHHSLVRDSHPDAGFIDRTLKEGSLAHKETSQDKVLAGLIGWHLARHAPSNSAVTSPWALRDDWRHGGLTASKVSFTLNGEETAVTCQVTCQAQGHHAIVQYETQRAELTSISFNGQQVTAIFQGQLVKGQWALISGNSFIVCTASGVHEMGIGDADHNYDAEEDGDKQLSAPMPGRVISVLAAVGDAVELGTPLIILEAMKMEHTIRAPFSGVVEDMFYATGDFVEEGVELARVKVV